MICHVLIAMVAGWVQRHQHQVLTSLLAENRVLNAQRGGRRLRLTETERRRRAALAQPLGRTRLQTIATLVTPATLLRWYKRLSAQKFDGSGSVDSWDAPVSLKRSNSSWSGWPKRTPLGLSTDPGCARQPGHAIDAITVRQYPAASPDGACSPTTEGWHALGPVPQAALGGPRRDRQVVEGRRQPIIGQIPWLHLAAETPTQGTLVCFAPRFDTREPVVALGKDKGQPNGRRLVETQTLPIAIGEEVVVQ